MPKIVACLITLFLFLFFHSPVFADSQVVINEFLADSVSGEGEWVEFYFPSGPIDISSYYLKDVANTKKTLNSLENCGNYAVYDLVTSTGNPSDGWLNNSGQESIFLYDGNDNLVDSFENWTSPGEGKTLGRTPDGSGIWQETENATRCQQNSQALSTPSPTPRPTPTSTSQSSSSTKTSSPTPKTSSVGTLKSPSPTEVIKSPPVLSATDQNFSLLPSSSNNISSPDSSPQATQSASPKTKVAAMLSGSGIILIGLSIGFYLWYKKVLGEPDNNTKNHKDNFEQKNNN